MHNKETITFEEAIKILGIEEYGDRIFSSNSHGELFFLHDYVIIAEMFEDKASWFKDWFDKTVKFAEDNWKRPESIFQHIPECLGLHDKGKENTKEPLKIVPIKKEKPNNQIVRVSVRPKEGNMKDEEKK